MSGNNQGGDGGGKGKRRRRRGRNKKRNDSSGGSSVDSSGASASPAQNRRNKPIKSVDSNPDEQSTPAPAQNAWGVKSQRTGVWGDDEEGGGGGGAQAGSPAGFPSLGKDNKNLGPIGPRPETAKSEEADGGGEDEEFPDVSVAAHVHEVKHERPHGMHTEHYQHTHQHEEQHSSSETQSTSSETTTTTTTSNSQESHGQHGHGHGHHGHEHARARIVELEEKVEELEKEAARAARLTETVDVLEKRAHAAEEAVNASKDAQKEAVEAVTKEWETKLAEEVAKRNEATTAHRREVAGLKEQVATLEEAAEAAGDKEAEQAMIRQLEGEVAAKQAIVDKQKAHLDKVGGDVEGTLRQLEEARAARQELEATLAKVGDVDAVLEEVEQLRSDKHGLETERDGLKKLLESQEEVDVAAVEEKCLALEREKGQLEDKVERLEAEVARRTEAYEPLKEQYGELKEKRKALETELAEEQARSAALVKKVAEAEAAAAAAAASSSKGGAKDENESLKPTVVREVEAGARERANTAFKAERASLEARIKELEKENKALAQQQQQQQQQGGNGKGKKKGGSNKQQEKQAAAAMEKLEQKNAALEEQVRTLQEAAATAAAAAAETEGNTKQKGNQKKKKEEEGQKEVAAWKAKYAELEKRFAEMETSILNSSSVTNSEDTTVMLDASALSNLGDESLVALSKEINGSKDPKARLLGKLCKDKVNLKEQLKEKELEIADAEREIARLQSLHGVEGHGEGKVGAGKGRVSNKDGGDDDDEDEEDVVDDDGSVAAGKKEGGGWKRGAMLHGPGIALGLVVGALVMKESAVNH